ncbi:hypothetical protein COT97_00115 [Candidatus Falkowbacteria bacterium CG10_big_fil_rev_8_21_14_0_10_39_11]|uniref:DAGKc domain-containing protein n=1 Tax=Candidatus Falkowbacteria bacterium CG10_big_fil_rev_8_21_14_0_10_39_11 TaxID=1974565 RepID=A0A2H0V6G0_9BACT|nr:MAG: hypothetical protein COT97_00115 [Candidatus Falkowbacteria bacterium CG10_big_fil_rev_8_21_14_0_10_39_11]
MYYYLYDSFLNDKKYEKVLDRIKTRLLDFEIQGRHERLTLLKTIDALIEDQVKRGVKAVVVVGNDNTFLKAVNVAARLGVTLSIIPIGENNQIAKTLGIPDAEKSCEILSARKLAQFDLGQVGDFYFFSSLKMSKNLDRISISHEGYRVIPKAKCHEVAIVNFHIPRPGLEGKLLKKVQPQDGKLDLLIQSAEEYKGFKKYFSKIKNTQVDTIIQGVNFEIKSFEYLPLMIDEYKVIKTPVAVKIADKKLLIIVGKNKNLIIK